MLGLGELRTFVTVAEAGSLAAAGHRVGRTPSAISMTLKQVEIAIGGALFEADRKAVLTPLGEVALHHARRAIEAHEGAVAEITRFARGEEGLVRIATTPSFARRVLPPVVAGLLTARPGIRLDVRDMESTLVAALVASGAVDFGVGNRVAAVRDLDHALLLADPFRVICRRDAPLAALGRRIAWADLTAETFIANDLSDALTGVDVAVELGAQARFRARNVSALYGFVEAGLGVSLLPSLAIPPIRTLVGLPLAAPDVEVRLHLMTRRGDVLSPAADAVRRALITATRHPENAQDLGAV